MQRAYDAKEPERLIVARAAWSEASEYTEAARRAMERETGAVRAAWCEELLRRRVDLDAAAARLATERRAYIAGELARMEER
jgi:hypothetical protein